MSGGKLLQLGTPQEIYRRPANVFVAGFIGSPPMNLLSASAAGGRVDAGDLVLEVPGAPSWRAGHRRAAGRPCAS